MIRRLYYLLKPLIPRRVQIGLRRWAVARHRARCADTWPIDAKAAAMPEGWGGWPEGKKFALVLTHDVDTQRGHDRVPSLLALERSLGFFSSFNFVAERYTVSPEVRQQVASAGFEVGVHGLYHDGKLYSSREVFLLRAARINEYIRNWGASGFRSPSMHHNLDWIHDLDIEYDASTFDTDPFEPQSDGVGTIFPFYVKSIRGRKGYVELPYTLPQDFTLFVLMQERTIDVWKKKLDWVAARGGMALVNAHPDYMAFDGVKPGLEEYPAEYYGDFLSWVRDAYKDQYWLVQPKDLARLWKRLYGKENVT